MSADDNDEGEEQEEPLVELGEGTPVEGAPLARVASRLTWPQKRSRVREKEGETVVRTADGPKRIGDLLDDTGITYFQRRREFVDAIESVTATGPVPTAE